MQGRVIQTSTWVVVGGAAAINFREGKENTRFTDQNPFIPHYVTAYEKSSIDYFDVDMHIKVANNMHKIGK